MSKGRIVSLRKIVSLSTMDGAGSLCSCAFSAGASLEVLEEACSRPIFLALNDLAFGQL